MALQSTSVLTQSSTKYTLAVVGLVVGIAVGCVVFALGMLLMVKSDRKLFNSNGGQVTPSSSDTDLLISNVSDVNA